VPNITRQSFARGVGEYLQRSGVTKIPTHDMLKQACAVASYEISIEPSAGAVPWEDTIKVAQHLVQFDRQLKSTGKFASVNQGASIGQNARLAYGDMVEGVMKLAMESGPSTIMDGKPGQKNLLSDSANAEAMLDDRPENYALVGQGGNTNIGEDDTARVGQEMAHPKAPSHGGAGSNSAVAASTQTSPSSARQKSAGIANALRKLAMGGEGGGGGGPSTIMGDDPEQQNLMNDSANSEAAMDAKRRPEGYANVGQGNANLNETGAANVGEEVDHPDQPSHSGASSNSVTEASKQASWEDFFSRTAHEIAPRLPKNMPKNEKVAAVKACMSKEPFEREEFLQKVAEAYRPVDQTASDLLAQIGRLTG